MRIVTLFMLAALVGMMIYVTGVTITGQSAAVMEEELVGCSLNTRIGFLSIDDIDQVCYRDDSLYFTVENLGSSELSGMMVHLESDYELTMLIKRELGAGEAMQQELLFGQQDMSGARSLTVYPVIGDRTVCDDSGITIDLKRC